MASFTFARGPLRIRLSVTWSQHVRGITSRLEDGYHVLMWDFDGVPLESVHKSLSYVQHLYRLPSIYIFSSGSKDGWHAYCLDRVTWQTAVYILMGTEHLDKGWLKLAVIRGYCTLRLSVKGKREVRYHSVLPSDRPEYATTEELGFAVDYWTGVLNHT